MTDVNTLNERTKLEAIAEIKAMQFQETADRLSAILIAVYKLPLEPRTMLLEQYYKNLETMKKEREKPEVECETCQDERAIEVIGDGEGFEVDVIGYKPCPDCKWEDPIQD